MKVRFRHRLFAYIIDILLLGIILLIMNTILVDNTTIHTLEHELDTLNDLFITKQIEIPNYIDQYSTIIYNLDKEKLPSIVINILYIIIYFVIIPYFWKGQTLGKKLLNTKIISKTKEKITITSLLIRNTIINGLGYLLLNIISLYLLPSNYYFITISILGIIQFLLVIISSFMILYRRDKRGLQDILSNTKVVYVEKTTKLEEEIEILEV